MATASKVHCYLLKGFSSVVSTGCFKLRRIAGVNWIVGMLVFLLGCSKNVLCGPPSSNASVKSLGANTKLPCPLAYCLCFPTESYFNVVAGVVCLRKFVRPPNILDSPVGLTLFAVATPIPAIVISSVKRMELRRLFSNGIKPMVKVMESEAHGSFLVSRVAFSTCPHVGPCAIKRVVPHLPLVGWINLMKPASTSTGKMFTQRQVARLNKCLTPAGTLAEPDCLCAARLPESSCVSNYREFSKHHAGEIIAFATRKRSVDAGIPRKDIVRNFADVGDLNKHSFGTCGDGVLCV